MPAQMKAFASSSSKLAASGFSSCAHIASKAPLTSIQTVRVQSNARTIVSAAAGPVTSKVLLFLLWFAAVKIDDRFSMSIVHYC